LSETIDLNDNRETFVQSQCVKVGKESAQESANFPMLDAESRTSVGMTLSCGRLKSLETIRFLTDIEQLDGSPF
jgi:hypothetical protein